MQFETTSKSFIGELRLHKQQRSMCVMADASFGGGHGDLWMTEGLVYEFWVKSVHRLFRAACLNVDPANKQVHMLIYGGDTWGLGAASESRSESAEWCDPVCASV